MDVILRNDPSLMDFQSYNEFTSDDVYDSEIFVEGAIGDKVKSVINKIIEFIKSIIKRIRGRFAHSRIERLKSAVEDPGTAEKLKQQETSAWNTELNIQFYQTGLDLVNTALNSVGSMYESNSTRDADKYVRVLETKINTLKKIVEQTRNNTDPNRKWSMYDAYNAIINESLWQARFTYVMESFNNLLKAHGKGKLEDFYEQSGVDKDKFVEVLTVTYEGLLVYSKGMTDGNMLFGKIAENGGYYRGKKASKTVSKSIRNALKEQGEDPDKFRIYRMRPTTESVYDTIDELDAYIEYAMGDLHDAMELRNRLIQESDDDTVEDFEESDTTDETPDDVEECGDGCKPTTEYYSNAIIRNYNEPVQENKTYCLKSNDMFTESYDEPSGPNRFYQETDPSLEAAAKAAEGVIRWAGIGINTGFVIALSAQAFAAIKVIDSVATSLTYNKKLGRFPSDIKRTMDILKNSKDGTTDTSQLAKALKDVKSETRALSGKGVISYKASKNTTYTERDELKRLYYITEDLLNMLSKKPDKAAARRVSARIDDFVTQVEKVMKLLNRGKNPGDVVKEYMS